SPFDAAFRLQDNRVVGLDREAAMASLREEREEHCVSVGEAFCLRNLKLGTCHRARRRVAFLNGSFCAVEDFYAGEIADLFFLPIFTLRPVPNFDRTLVGAEFEFSLTVDTLDCCYLVASTCRGRPRVDEIVVCQPIWRSDKQD